MKNLTKSLGVIILATVIVASAVYATTITFTPPAGTTANYRTLGDIYAKLTNFSLNPSATHSVSTTTSPAGSFHTLGEIYTLLTDENQDLIASKIATGTVIFGVRGTLESGAGGDALSWSTNQGRGNWSVAMSRCSGVVDGSTGWRLPTAIEIVFRGMQGRVDGSLPIIFPESLPGSYGFWSSDTAPDETNGNIIYQMAKAVAGTGFVEGVYPNGVGPDIYIRLRTMPADIRCVKP